MFARIGGMKEKDIACLLGKTLTKAEVNGISTEIDLWTEDGEHYLMYHDQDCCENVWLEDICGNLEDILGSPITLASEDTSDDEPPEGHKGAESWTWTFYTLQTVKGTVTLRWCGTSNGYYSERVSFVLLAS